MGRTTVYTLYKTGRTDPTLTHIWGFESPQERYTWLNSKPSLEFTAQKYWRVGNTIKIPVSYETSFEYDYIRIINDLGTAQQREWYAFIAARAYISPSVTLLSIDVDYIQTFYFTGQVPFWDTTGFIVRSTAHLLPIPGTPSDFPVAQSQTLSFTHEDGNYAFVMYSTIDPATVTSTPAYQGIVQYGVYSAAAPYVYAHSNPATAATAITTAVENFNTAGLTDAILAIYAVPARYFVNAVMDGNPHVIVQGTTQGYTLTMNLSSNSQLECAYLLDDYDYTYILINNGQGETAVFRGYEFTGNPQFGLSIAFTAGSPTLFLTPLNLKYANTGGQQTYTMKITQAISCTYLNDSYRIWLAQTQNSRAAAVAGAELAISQAEEARSKSWAYQYGGIISGGVEALREPITSGVSGVLETIGALPADPGTGGGGKGFLKTADDLDPELVASWNRAHPNTPLHQTPGATPATYNQSRAAINNLYTLGATYLYHQLGVETTYTYDHAVANAQQSLNALMASYKDKARVPATARGSNAYGDMAAFRQYGFMISVTGPSTENYALLNDMLRASGHTINRLDLISRYHEVFDYYMVNSARIPVNTSVRPEFVRKMMLDLLQKGVYLWYIDSGDISPYFGTPFGIQNDEVGNG